MKKLIENILPFIIVFTASLFRPYDADLGWHLKYGEYFFKYHQILKDNTFSTMMQNYKWPNTSWGIDLIYYFFFNNFGFLGLTILGALIITLTFLFFSKAFNLDYWQKSLIFPILIFIENPINQVSFRGSLVSMLFLGILFYLIEKYQSNKSRIIYLTIPLFLFWANIHGQFILGLGLFLIWAIFYLVSLYITEIKNLLIFKKEMQTLFAVFILAVLATLIHPFGLGIYKDAFLHFGNKYLKDIAEYLPFDERSSSWWNQLIIGILVSLGAVFLYFEDKFKKYIPDFGVFTALYFLAWSIKRYAWSMYYTSILFLKPLASFIKPENKKTSFYLSTAFFLIYFFITLYLKSPFKQYTNMSWNAYCSEFQNCSPKSVEYLIKNNLNKNLLTMYNWGGWIIWNYPQIKPSIDGRMHLWEDEKGYSGFADYYKYEQNLRDINSSEYNVVLMSPEKPVYNRLVELVKEKKWKVIYKDKYSGIFVRQPQGSNLK